jgi:tetratricopeptide (TPR) repeat protein
MGHDKASNAQGEQEAALTQLDETKDQVFDRAMFSEAKETLEQNLVNEPECGFMCNIKRWVNDELYAEAREVLETEIDNDPSNLDNVVALTSVDIRDEEYSQAYRWAQTYIEEGFSNISLMENRAVASMLNHDMETAFEDFRSLISRLQSMAKDTETTVCHPLHNYCSTPEQREAHAWANLATVQYNRGNLDEAEQIAKDLLENKEIGQHVSSLHSEFVLALTAAKRNNDQEAKTRYERILKASPMSAGALNNLGGVYYRAHDLATARAYFEAAYVNAGTWRRAAAISWSNVGEVDVLEGDYEAAEDKLLEAANISKGYAGADFGLASLYDLMDKGELSKRHFAKAMALDSHGVTRWNFYFYNTEWENYFKALLAEHQGNEQEAKALWVELLDADEERLQKRAESHLAAIEKPLAFFRYMIASTEIIEDESEQPTQPKVHLHRLFKFSDKVEAPAAP